MPIPSTSGLISFPLLHQLPTQLLQDLAPPFYKLPRRMLQRKSFVRQNQLAVFLVRLQLDGNQRLLLIPSRRHPRKHHFEGRSNIRNSPVFTTSMPGPVITMRNRPPTRVSITTSQLVTGPGHIHRRIPSASSHASKTSSHVAGSLALHNKGVLHKNKRGCTISPSPC